MLLGAHAQSDSDNVLLPRSAAAPQFGLSCVCVSIVSRRLVLGYVCECFVLCRCALVIHISSVQLLPLTTWDAGITRSSTPAESRDGSMFMVCVCLLLFSLPSQYVLLLVYCFLSIIYHFRSVQVTSTTESGFRCDAHAHRT